MSDQDDWINEIIPPEEVEQIQTQANKIIKGQETFYEMTVLMTQEDMIEAVRALELMREGDMTAWMLGMSILTALVDTMEYALERDEVQIWDEENE
jgi:hypothetical protein